jgi:hypothetical protein
MTNPNKPQSAPLVFAPYVFQDENSDPEKMHRQSAQSITDAITQIGTNKTTDKKISAACKKHGVDESRVRTIAGFNKNGVNEYKVQRSVWIKE